VEPQGASDVLREGCVSVYFYWLLSCPWKHKSQCFISFAGRSHGSVTTSEGRSGRRVPRCRSSSTRGSSSTLGHRTLRNAVQRRRDCNNLYCLIPAPVGLLQVPGMARPLFEKLPLGRADPPFSAWGLYGTDDELGTLNLLTPEVVAEASKEIKTGMRVGLDLPLNFLKRPSHDRQPLKHNIIKYARPNHDDSIELNTQVSFFLAEDNKTRTRLR